MKKCILNIITFTLFFITSNFQCEDENAEFNFLECYSTNLEPNNSLNINDSLKIIFSDRLKYLTIYPGDSTHIYGNPMSSGIQVEGYEFRYKYDSVGWYYLTIIHSNYKENISENKYFENRIKINVVN